MFSVVVSSVNKLVDDADEVVIEAFALEEQANDALVEMTETVADVHSVVKVLNDTDLASIIDSLHGAVENLNTVIAPLAKIVGAASVFGR